MLFSDQDQTTCSHASRVLKIIGKYSLFAEKENMGTRSELPDLAHAYIFGWYSVPRIN